MKKSTLVFCLFIFIVVCLSIYICLATDARVYVGEAKETEIEVPQIIQTKEKQEKVEEKEKIEPINLGNFKLTAYCPCSLCCEEWAYNRPNGIVYGAIGEELKEGYSIAVDPNIIPYRTEVEINGKTYKAQDCGGAIKGNRIDVYFESHTDALSFGVQYADVFIKM